MFRSVWLFMCLAACVVCLSSCSGLSTSFNPATDQQETSMYSTEREQQIGAAVAQEMEKQFDVLGDVELNERLDRITERLAAVCDRKEIVYITKAVDLKESKGEPLVNAVALPGGYVYVFKGLVDKVKNDDQLAAVIAHEIAHVTARHSMKRLEASYGSLIAVLAGMQAGGQVAGGLSAAVDAMFIKYSQEDELMADNLGIKYLKAAGFRPEGMVEMLEILQAHDKKQPIRPKMYYRTHPYVHQRIAIANQLVRGELTFRDYVRSTGELEDK